MTQSVLMCRPDHFGIEYEINPWMHVAVEVDHALAAAQWQALYQAAAAFRDLAPWAWMTDRDLFAVEDPATGEVGYGLHEHGFFGPFPKYGLE